MQSLWRPEEDTRFPLELELQVVVSQLMWVLAFKLRSSGRAANTFGHWSLSSVSKSLISNRSERVNFKIIEDMAKTAVKLFSLSEGLRGSGQSVSMPVKACITQARV